MFLQHIRRFFIFRGKNMTYHFVVIEGNIGVGKTSLARKIGEEMNAKIILEQFADNSFLPKFYENPEKYSFPLELSFLAERYYQLKNELSHDLFKTFTIADYYFMKSLIFAKTTLQDDEYLLYKKLFNIIYSSLPKPALYVYLHAPVERLLQNIRQRGRAYEQQMEAGYLQRLQDAYFSFFRQHRSQRFLVLDVTDVDFVHNQTDYKRLLSVIFDQQHPPGITRVVL